MRLNWPRLSGALALLPLAGVALIILQVYSGALDGLGSLLGLGLIVAPFTALGMFLALLLMIGIPLGLAFGAGFVVGQNCSAGEDGRFWPSFSAGTLDSSLSRSDQFDKLLCSLTSRWSGKSRSLGDGHARHPPRPARARSPARGVLRHLRALGRARSRAADRRRARRLLRRRQEAAIQLLEHAHAIPAGGALQSAP